MKKRIIAAVAALMLIMTAMPAAAAAADGDKQLIPVTPAELFDPEQTAPAVSVEITQDDPVVWNGYRGKIYEITLPEAGTLSVVLTPAKGTKGTEMILSASKDFSKASGSWNTVYTWSDLDSLETDFLESGSTGEKYYLAVVNDAGSFRSQLSFRAAFYAAKGRTIDLGKTYAFGGSHDIKYHDFKFTAAKSGYVSVDFFSAGENDTTFSLLNQNKKRISGQYNRLYDVEYPMYFGVQKGKTYYLQAYIRGLPSMYDPYSIRLDNHGIQEKSGAARKKAVSVKKNKTVKGYVLPGKKQSDWYKIKVTKTRTVKVFVRNKFSDECFFDIYDKRGKKRKIKQKLATTDGGVLSKTKYARFAKGTYYIKVYNKKKGDSGGYHLKWK